MSGKNIVDSLGITKASQLRMPFRLAYVREHVVPVECKPRVAGDILASSQDRDIATMAECRQYFQTNLRTAGKNQDAPFTHSVLLHIAGSNFSFDAAHETIATAITLQIVCIAAAFTPEPLGRTISPSETISVWGSISPA